MIDDGGDVRVRAARTTDLAAVVALEGRCFGDPWTPAALLGELTADYLRLPLVVEVAGQLRGYLMAWLVADQLHILNIATDPDFQRRGLGTVMLLAAARQGAAQGLTEITLEVRRSNQSARRFYENHGFGETGVRLGYYADDNEDALIMTCTMATVLDHE